MEELLRAFGNMDPRGRPCHSKWFDIHLCVPQVFLTNPHQHENCKIEPGLDGWSTPWGIPVDEDEEPFAAMKRKMQTQHIYEFGERDTPEVQWVNVLARRKLEKLRKVAPAQHDLIIDVDLVDVAPRVWRRVRVSARMPLVVLQDKMRAHPRARCCQCRQLVLLSLPCDALCSCGVGLRKLPGTRHRNCMRQQCTPRHVAGAHAAVELPKADATRAWLQVLIPLMGWVRNYHAFLFMDPTDGSMLGPSRRNGAIDMMHLEMHAVHTIDVEAEKLTLGHFLCDAGDKLGFLYDLGDKWTHELKVVEAVPAEESDGRVEVLDGAMQCPPEDSNGALLHGPGAIVNIPVAPGVGLPVHLVLPLSCFATGALEQSSQHASAHVLG
jgi:Plasmid pRiA4b ORF-3-like protein